MTWSTVTGKELVPPGSLQLENVFAGGGCSAMQQCNAAVAAAGSSGVSPHEGTPDGTPVNPPAGTPALREGMATVGLA